MTREILRRNILTSYLICVPSGLLTIIVVFAILTKDGLAGILLVDTYGWGIIGLIISFLIAIWFASKVTYKSVTNGRSLLNTSFRFSLTINSIIWSVFTVLTIVKNIKYNFLFVTIFPLIGFIVSLIVTTFTLGLLISYIFARNFKNEKE